MANRLTSITTRTGDTGETGLADGSRVAKDHALIRAIGDVDELNSFIGVLAAQIAEEKLRLVTRRIQNDLFDLGGSLAMSACTLTAKHVEHLDRHIESWNADLPALKEFILPGGSIAVSQCHVARAVCRRAERSLVALARESSLDPVMLQYLNRLSDLLFVLARVIARHEGVEEVYWQPGR